MMKRQIATVGIVAIMVLANGAVSAQSTPAPAAPQVGAPAGGGPGGGGPGGGRRRAARQSPCAADLENFCANVERGQGRYRDCLQQHESDLSPACKEHVQAGAAGAAGGRSRWQSACSTELDKSCKDVQDGQGRVRQCLLDHEAELGSDCKAAVHARGAWMR